jgi:hypothetical protein
MDRFNEYINIENAVEEWSEKVYNGEARPYQLINSKVKSFLKELKNNDIQN